MATPVHRRSQVGLLAPKRTEDARRDDAYARGRELGQVEARLDAHDQKFLVINGNIARFATESAGLADAVRGLSADIKSTHDTAAALRLADKDRADEIQERRKELALADDERRKKSEARWTPLNRALLVLTLISTIIGVVLAVLAMTNSTFNVVHTPDPVSTTQSSTQ